MNNKLLSKNYVVLLISASLFYIVSFMLNTISARYSIDIGASKTVSGVIACGFPLMSFFTRPVWGWISDKKGRKIVYLAGAAFGIVSCTILLFADKIWILLISRLLFGAGYSAVTTAGGTMVCDIAPEDKLKKAISFYGVTNVLSQAIAPVCALMLYETGFIWVAITAIAVAVSVIVSIFFVSYPEKKFTDPSRKFKLFEKNALPAAYTIIFFAMSTSSVNSFIAVMAQDRNISGDKWFFAVSALLLLRTRIVNSKLSTKYGEIKLFYAGNIIYIAAFIGLVFTHNMLLLIVSAVFYGIGAGIVHPIVNTAAVKDVSSADRGLATGTFMMSQDLGMAAGAVVWGFVSGKMGFGAVYTIVSVLLLLMMYVFRLKLTKILK